MNFLHRQLTVRSFAFYVAVTLGIGAINYFSSATHGLPDHFTEMQINSRILIQRYNHDLPVVKLVHDSVQNRVVTLVMPTAASHYLQNGDSLVKRRGLNRLQVIRDSADVQIVTEWAYQEDANESSCVLRKLVKNGVKLVK
jgi:hypothetical protein